MNDPRHYTRRQQLRILLPAIALGLGFKGGKLGDEAEQKEHKPFSFIAVNDLHFLDAECRPFFEKVVLEMKRSAPNAAFCLVSGDLSDRGTPEALTAIREILSGLDMPVHVVPGNHDYLSQTDRSGYDAIFPDHLNRHFTHEGWQFIGLDTTDGTKASDTMIAASTFDFLDEAKLDPKMPTVVFTHFPLGEGVKMRPKNGAELLGKLLDVNLRGVFSGHWHGASERDVNDAVILTDRCCSRFRMNHDGSPLKGWFVCEATPEGILEHHFAEAPAVENPVAAPAATAPVPAAKS